MSRKYFENLNLVLYDNKIAKNILSKVIPVEGTLNNSSVFYQYTIEGWDTPENLAAKLYGNPDKHWVILIINEIIDPFYDWVMTEEEIFRYAKEMYGADINAIHHYENEDGDTVGCSSPEITTKMNCMSGGYEWFDDSIETVSLAFITPITNLNFEQQRNDNKREIKILRPEFVDRFCDQFYDLMQ
jgi:hypothetical protein